MPYISIRAVDIRDGADYPRKSRYLFTRTFLQAVDLIVRERGSIPLKFSFQSQACLIVLGSAYQRAGVRIVAPRRTRFVGGRAI